MTLGDLANLFIGSIIGTFLSLIAPKINENLTNWVKNKKILKRKILLKNNQSINKWIVEYYKRNNNVSNLFNCKIGTYEIKIPFITKKEWIINTPFLPFQNSLFHYAETDEQDFNIDNRAINKRQNLGQKLFNDPTLYLDRLESINGFINLHVKDCDYYHVATNLIKLEEETFKAVQKNKFTNLAMRDKFFSSAETIEKLLLKPFSMGCSTVLALRTNDSYEFILHTRSHSTICAGGLKTGLPNFGLAPIFGGSKGQIIGKNSRDYLAVNPNFNLIYYNFIKEYLEELYNYEELIKAMSSRNANPFWFYDLPEGKFLINLINHKQFILNFLGFGFEAVNGTAMVTFLGIINDAKASNELKANLKLNWEVSEKKGMVEIDYVDINSPLLEEWLKQGLFTASGAFTISRALEVIKLK